MKLKKLFSGRKAQITIFIIIGIVLLFSSALIFYIKNKVTNTTPASTVVQSTPEELTGLNKYIEDCIYSTGKDAVKLIGAHGGYIYPEDFNIHVNTANPTEGDGVEIMAGSGMVVPYWYYLSSSNKCAGDCRFSTKIPMLKGEDSDTVESQISDYVDKNVKTCLNNFKVYKDMGYDVKELGTLKTKTTITMEDVVLDISWPIEAGRTDTGKLKRINTFVVRLPVNLKQIYEFSQEIIKKESDNNIIATNTLNLITYHSDRNKKQLPPMADFSAKPDMTTTWDLKETNKDLSTILFLYTPLLRVRNTKNGYVYYYPTRMSQTIMDKMMIDLQDNDTYHDLNVDFRYSEKWPIYLDITPRNGDKLEAKDMLGGFGVLPMLGLDLKSYEFQYDLSYPVLIKVDDPSAFNNEGYSFLFAIETNIRNNKPLNASFAPITVSNNQRSFVCDEQQKKSGNITVNAFDAATKKPLEGVSVVFSFGKQGCEIGMTEKPANKSKKASLTERYPIGIGTLTFSKSDYTSLSMLYAVGEGKNDEINISLYPKADKKVELKIYHMDKTCVLSPIRISNWYFNSTPQNLSSKEEVNIVINKVVTLESPERDDSAVFFNISNINNASSNIVSLLPGEYEVMITTMVYENISIPAQTLVFGSGDNKQTTVIPGTSMYPASEGIMRFNNETYYFKVKPEDLYTNTTLRLFAVVYDLKSVPVACRTLYPNDVMPDNPSMASVMVDKKPLLIPRFV